MTLESVHAMAKKTAREARETSDKHPGDRWLDRWATISEEALIRLETEMPGYHNE